MEDIKTNIMLEKKTINEYLTFQKLSSSIYTKMCEEVCKQHNITLPECNLLLFFANNPEYDTAIDAVNMRLFSKAYVSKAIYSLTNKQLITVKHDKKDRRYQHIKINPSAMEIARQLQKVQCNFVDKLTKELSDEEKNIAENIFVKIIETMKDIEKEN